ncbi:type VI secretion system contractile sheath large subunit [Aureimonas pseudogalii]|uniref:Type VI secretion system protein ImpD n=1 Tax=Aureimonas pseudogalii TaxID=1744844 RepID=A0A7W6MM33_9HYPH|nr:type VI secretion system contractile sheath large subunit [Aureimonas pseudogalii]MBB4000437.1 type VI secretion system protein ImpD [Aureimonas pseudogalii]
MQVNLSSPSEGERIAGIVAPPLGLRLTEALFDEDEAGESDLARFVGSDDTAEALQLWFGDRLQNLLTRTGGGLRAAIDRDIAAIDDLLSVQVDEILHRDEFQALEASWRGLDHLLASADNDERVVVRIMSATWAELARDFNRASEFDRSLLFERLYSDEFGMPGGLPYGLVLCDYEIQHRHGAARGIPGDDISTLASLAGVAAAAFAPCVIGASPALLGVEEFSELSFVQDIALPFRGTDYARWRALQAQDDSRFLAVTAPRILLRRRHADSGARTDGFRYEEGRHGLPVKNWLFGNGVYAFGAVVVTSFRDWSWFADIRGTRQDESGAGLVENLPSAPFSTGEAEAYRRPLEVELTDRKQKQMEEIGLMTLSPCRYTPNSAFLGAPSLHAPAHAGTDVRAANERISSMLQYILCVSRFAHYIKVIARDVMGAFTTADELQSRLSTWLQQYVTGNADAPEELKAQYPLNSSRVEIREVPGKPGSFACVMHLKPHFQIDQMVASFRLFTELNGLRER